jgi:hypothetical protein
MSGDAGKEEARIAIYQKGVAPPLIYANINPSGEYPHKRHCFIIGCKFG